ncbi:MAG: hypothetical protein RX316_05780 [bacterium]|nr:hypothetical protein [bacterium]
MGLASMRKLWKSVVWVVFVIGPGLWQLVRWLGDIDFIIERTRDPAWLAEIMAILLSLTPSQSFFLTAMMITVGLGLLYWGLRRDRQRIRDVHHVTLGVEAVGRPTLKTKVIWEGVNSALLWIVNSSAWMRWQDAQHLANNGKPLGEQNKIHLAVFVFLKKAETGVLTIRGRRHGHLEYEEISPDVWVNTYLDIQRDVRTLWRVTMKARHGLEQKAMEQVPDYESFQVSEEKVLGLWPREDKKLDALTKKLLKQDKKRKERTKSLEVPTALATKVPIDLEREGRIKEREKFIEKLKE